MRRWRGRVPAVAILLLAATAALADPMPSPAELLSLGRVDEALRVLRDRVQSSPRDAESYHLLTRTYFYMGRWDDAVAAAEKAVALQPNTSDYHLWLARAAGEKAAHSSFITAVRMVGRIRAEFEQAVQLNGANVAARSDLAEFYMEAPPFLGGGKDKALAQAQQLDGLDPSAAHWIRARLAEKGKQYEEAEREYRGAIAESKHPAGRWLDLAYFYRSTGRLDQMEDAVNHAVAEGTRPSTVPYEAAMLLYQAGRNFPGAIRLLEGYLASGAPVEAAPAYEAHYLLGAILEKQGNRQAAATEYRAALALAHDFDQAQAGLKRLGK